MTITEFLLARVADDETAARAATSPPYHVQGTPWGKPLEVVADSPDSRASHWLAVDPARVLADCEAKRLIVALADEATGLDSALDLNARVGARDMDEEPYLGDQILSALALPYAGHPDYLEEWRP